jgi:Tfp pilus assembly protein PilN
VRAVNLIPSDQRSEGGVGSRSEGAVFGVLGLLVGLAVLVVLYGSAHHRLTTGRAEAAELTARAQQVQAQAAQLASYTSFVAMREQRLNAISQLASSRFDWSAVMGELSRVLPTDVALSSLQGTVGSTTGSSSSSSTTTTSASAHTGGGPVTSATPPGTVPTFTLTGCAASQAVVAQTLVRLRLVSGVSVVNLLSSTKSSSAGGAGSGSCPDGDPVFSAQVTFSPLPMAPSTNVQALESTVSVPGAGAGHAKSASAKSTSVRPYQ